MRITDVESEETTYVSRRDHVKLYGTFILAYVAGIIGMVANQVSFTI